MRPYKSSRKTTLSSIALLLCMVISACGGGGSSTSGSGGSGGGLASNSTLPAPVVQPLLMGDNSMGDDSTGSSPNPSSSTYGPELNEAFFQWALDHSPRRPRVDGALMRQMLTDITASDPHHIKVELDTLLEQLHGRAPRYNRNATAPLAPMQRNLLQCSSSTLFFELARRFAPNAYSPYDGSPVIILQSGHVLPGYTLRDYNNNWHLYGVETTASGEARLYFGTTANLDNTTYIVHADHYIDLLVHGAEASDLLTVAQTALLTAATDFNIAETTVRQHPVFEASAARAMRALQRTMSRRNFDGASHPLVFGRSNQRAGTIARQEITTSGTALTNYTSPRELVHPPAPAAVTAPAPAAAPTTPSTSGGMGTVSTIFMDSETLFSGGAQCVTNSGTPGFYYINQTHSEAICFPGRSISFFGDGIRIPIGITLREFEPEYYPEERFDDYRWTGTYWSRWR